MRAANESEEPGEKLRSKIHHVSMMYLTTLFLKTVAR
jgi:hypothetical protein